MTATEETRCSVCRSPLVGRVDDLLADGQSTRYIAEFTASRGLPLGRMAISRHQRSGHAIIAPTPTEASQSVAGAIVASFRAGEGKYTAHTALRAEKQLREIRERSDDEEILYKLAQAMAGNVERPAYQPFPGFADVPATEEEFLAQREAYETRVAASLAAEGLGHPDGSEVPQTR